MSDLSTLTADVAGDDLVVPEVRVEGDNFAVTLEYIGEGEDGDWDPSDASDRPLLRFNAEQRADGEWEDVDSGSYCTQIDARCTAEERQQAANYLLAQVELRSGSESPKRICEGLSWTSLETVAKASA